MVANVRSKSEKRSQYSEQSITRGKTELVRVDSETNMQESEYFMIPVTANLAEAKRIFERDFIKNRIQSGVINQKHLADKLQIPKSTLSRLMAEHGLSIFEKGDF